MKSQANLKRLFVPFLVTICFSAAIAQSRMPLPPMEPQSKPYPQGTNPVPQDATKAILAAFDKYEVVGMSAAHGAKDLDDFLLALIRNPAFPGKVNDIAVECGNSLYQPILDRYIAGENVPIEEVRQVWRNTTQPMCGVSAFYEQLFPLIRRINQSLPSEKKLRVLAADPPVDWSKINTRHDLATLFNMDRDASIAAVMKTEVLEKHRKALMLFGSAHLYHGANDPMGPTAVGIYEKTFPGVTMVVATHEGFGNDTPLAKYNAEFEARLASWPVPSLAAQLKGTWLADLLNSNGASGNIVFGKIDPSESALSDTPQKFSETLDAYLYLGPRDLQLSETPPGQVFLDKKYMAELQRRAAIISDPFVADQSNPEKIPEVYSPFYYNPEEFQKAMKLIRMSPPPARRNQPAP